MALITPSAIVSDIKGKISGSVFQNSLGGLVMKSGTGRTNRNSINQSLLKSITANVQNGWFALSDAQRSTWSSFAKFVNVQQIKNTGLYVNGQQLFIKSNVIRAFYGLSSLSDPQFSRCITLSVSFTVALSGADLILTSSRLVDSDVEFIVCYATFPVRPTINNPGSRYRLLVFSTTTDTTFDISSAYTAVFGRKPIAGETIFVKAFVANLFTGIFTQASINKSTL